MNNTTKVIDPRKGLIHGTIVSRILSLLSIIYSWYNDSRKIWRGIKFGALADRPTDRQIKNPPIFNTRIYDMPSRIIMGVVDLGQAHERELIVDLSCFLTCMLGGVRFYYYLPCRCIDSSPKLACHR